MPWCRPSSSKDFVKVVDLQSRMLEELPKSLLKHKRTLLELHANNNMLCYFPQKVFNLLELKVLSLEDNNISNVPFEIGYLTKLERLNLSKNEIVDVSDNICNLTNLIELNLSANVIQILPQHITKLKNLKYLYVNDTSLVLLPRDINLLSKLETIDARENFLLELPESICLCESLTWADFGCNDISKLPESIGKLVNLRELYVDSNSLTELPEELCSNLVNFDVSKNKLCFIPDGIGKLVHLKELVIEHNKLMHLPATIGNLKNLSTLRLSSNIIEELPTEIASLIELKELHVSRNNLKRLPENIDQLSYLEVLNLDFNELRRLPDALCSCSALRILSLAKNKLRFLPEEIGKMVALRVLELCYNELSFLPLSIRNLRLNALWLSKNQPRSLINLQIMNDEEHGKVLVCYLLPQHIIQEFSEEKRVSSKKYVSSYKSNRSDAGGIVTINPLINDSLDIPDYPLKNETLDATVNAPQYMVDSVSQSSESSNSSPKNVLSMDPNAGVVLRNSHLFSSENEELDCDDIFSDVEMKDISYFETRIIVVKSVDLTDNFVFPVKFKGSLMEPYHVFDNTNPVFIHEVNEEFIKTDPLIRPGDRILKINNTCLSDYRKDAKTLSETLREDYERIKSFTIRRDPPLDLFEKIFIKTDVELFGGQYENGTYTPLYININSNGEGKQCWLIEVGGKFLMYQPLTYANLLLHSYRDRVEAVVFHFHNYFKDSGFPCTRKRLRAYRTDLMP